MECRPAGWSAYLPLLIFPYTIKSRSSLLALAHLGGPRKRAVKRLCVCVCLHMLFFCVFFPHLSFFVTFSLLIYSLTYLFLWESTCSISRPEFVIGDQTWAFLVVLVYFMYVIFVFLMHDYLCSFDLGLLFSPIFLFFFFSVLVKRLAGKSISEMCWVGCKNLQLISCVFFALMWVWMSVRVEGCLKRAVVRWMGD